MIYQEADEDFIPTSGVREVALDPRPESPAYTREEVTRTRSEESIPTRPPLKKQVSWADSSGSGPLEIENRRVVKLTTDATTVDTVKFLSVSHRMEGIFR